MVTVAEEMTRQGFKLPLLIGGATTSKVHTAVRIAPRYKGTTVHVLDASRAVGVCTALVSESGDAGRRLRRQGRGRVRGDPGRARRRQQGKGRSARSRRAPTPSRSTGRPTRRPSPPCTGTRVFAEYPLHELIERIDWTPFFRAWELAGNYPAILEDKVVGDSARKLYADARKMLDHIVREKWLTAKGVVAFWPCRRDGDDVVLFEDDTRSQGDLAALFPAPADREARAARQHVPGRLHRARGRLDRRLRGHRRPRHRGASRALQGRPRRLFRHPAEGAGRPPGRGLRRAPARARAQDDLGLRARRGALQRGADRARSIAASARRRAIPPAPTTARSPSCSGCSMPARTPASA